MNHLLIFGLGYSGRAIAQAAGAAGFHVTATTRAPAAPQPGVAIVDFSHAPVAAATHIVITAAPDEQGDPVLARHGGAIAAAERLRWLGYLSTTGVYGNRDGGWVDEASEPRPGSARTRRRVEAERGWRALAARHACALDIFRLAGIYGPGRSMFDDLRAGTARHVVKPGHLFGRIHRDDIARGVVRAMTRGAAPGVAVFNFTDDEPAASADVVCEAARLLGVPPPPPVPFAQAETMMTPMARSFWADNRRVSNARTKEMLGLRWLYPDYRAGLRAIRAAEAARPGAPGG